MTEVKIGDKFRDDFVGTVEVIHVSPFGQIVYSYEDGSVDVAENVEEMNERNLFLVDDSKISIWINICKSINNDTAFFDEGMYESKESAIQRFQDVWGHYELVDTIKVTWEKENARQT